MKVKAFSRVSSRTLDLITNLRGWRTDRKLLVIESDDWGAIRMPGLKAYESLLKYGFPVDCSPYDRLDCLETEDDLQALFNLIDAHRDASGRPAIFTFNTVMGNPDFEAIKRDGYSRFHHLHFFDSYEEYNGERLESVWRDAMENKLMRPQFHGREHINSVLWLKDLAAGNKETRLAFKHRFCGLNTQTGSPYQKHYRAAYWPDSLEHLNEISRIVVDGLDQFKHTFGYSSKTFIACNYVWPDALETLLAEYGVEMLQGQRGQICPDPEQNGKPHIRRHFTGQMNGLGQLYSVRNVLFEPHSDSTVDWVDKACKQISNAFLLRKPAVMTTHRVNYVSGMSTTNRDRNLGFLQQLLSRLKSRWPTIEFTTSDELARAMKSDSRNTYSH